MCDRAARAAQLLRTTNGQGQPDIAGTLRILEEPDPCPVYLDPRPVHLPNLDEAS